MTAQRIRAFLDALFPYRAVNQLKAHLDEVRAERDYFKARADRLELMLLAPFTRRAEGVQGPKPNEKPIGRKPWAEVEREWMAKEFAPEAKNVQGSGRESVRQ